MYGPSMAPRSYAYSGGERVPYIFPRRSDVESAAQAVVRDEPQVPAYGISRETTPPGVRQGGGFLRTINDIAGALLPIVDAARYFKAGYQGLPLPGREAGDSRMAGDQFIFQVYQDMLKRNEREAELARQERKESSEADLRRQLILKGVEKGDISLQNALKALETGQIEFGTPSGTDRLPSQTPAASAP